MQTSAPIVGSWHVNLVLFCFDSGQVPQRCLVLKFLFSITCFGLYHKCTRNKVQTLSRFNFFPLAEKALYILMTFSQ